jgi:hypothetical protein
LVLVWDLFFGFWDLPFPVEDPFLTTLRNRLDDWLIQFRWNWQELTWRQLLIRIASWVAVIAVVVVFALWWRSKTKSEPSLKALQTDLRSSNASVRNRAYEKLFGREDAAGCFAYALRDENVEVRRDAAYALSTYTHSLTAAVPALIEALTDRDEEIRLDSVKALGRTDERAEVVISALKRVIFTDESVDVRMWAELSVRDLERKRDPGASSRSGASSPPEAP